LRQNVRLSAFCLTPLLALSACGSSSNSPPPESFYASCTDVDASSTCPSDAVTFAAVQPILARSCLPACHDNSPDAAWPLTDFDDVQAWTTFIAQDLLGCTMPPAASAYPMSREDRETILDWIACDAPP
jgi:hypothetical protein